MKTMKRLVVLVFAISLMMAMSLQAMAAADTSVERDQTSVVNVICLYTEGGFEEGIPIQSNTGFVVDQRYVVVSRHAVTIDSATKEMYAEYFGVTKETFDQNTEFWINTSAGNSCRADSIFEDKQADIAILKMESSMSECSDVSFLSSSAVAAGDRCYALGYPNVATIYEEGENDVITIPGKVKDKKTIEGVECIGFDSDDGSTTAGPLVKEDGNVIGFITGIERAGANISEYAVSADTLLRYFDKLGISYDRQGSGTGTDPGQDSNPPATPSSPLYKQEDITQPMIIW